MDDYIVSARKYRPMTFDSVVGQEAITTTLKNAISTNQLAQAFLFCGPRGVGKTTCARILAKTINCFHPTENIEACNKCESCISFDKNVSYNIHELDAASNNSVDHIRNLSELVRIRPQVGEYKIYIIDEVHMLSQAAFNAFLKTLEEPPSYAKFILATTEKNKIIPTILSRCQVFDFKRITVDDIVNHLKFVASKENVQAEEEALRVIAQKADGAMRDALSIFDQQIAFSGNNLTYKNVIDTLNVLDYDYYFKIVDYVINNDITGLLLTINKIFDNGFEGQHLVLGLGEHLRSLLVSKDPLTVSLLHESESVKQRFELQSKACDSNLLTDALNIISKCDVEYKISSNKRLLVEVALLNIANIFNNTEKKNLNLNQSKTEKISIVEAKKKINIVGQPSATPSSTPISGTRNIKTIPRISDKENTHDNGVPILTNNIKPFTKSDAEQVLEEFLEQIKDSNFFLFNSLLDKEVDVENEMITINLVNDIAEKSVLEHNFKIVDFFRNKLQNDQISIVVKVDPSVPKSTPIYTNIDKFKKMVEENKNIILLKNKLNLEID